VSERLSVDSSELIVQKEEVMLHGNLYAGWTTSFAVSAAISSHIVLDEDPCVHRMLLQGE